MTTKLKDAPPDAPKLPGRKNGTETYKSPGRVLKVKLRRVMLH